MAVIHKVTFTPTDGDAVTLADLADGSHYNVVRWPGAASKEIAEMFESDEVEILPLGNIRGQVVLQCWQSYDDAGSAAADFVAKRALLNAQGVLDLIYLGAELAMGRAMLSDFEPPVMVGVRWEFRYTFDITTVSLIGGGTTGSSTSSTGD